MLCVIAFHAGDKDQAVRLANWIRDLGGVGGHRCLLVVALGTDSRGVMEPLREAFAEVSEISPVERVDGWPQGPNSLWDTALRHLHQKEAWFFLEPDAIPLKRDWLDAIEAEYRRCGKPFMGDLAEVGKVARHLSGVSVYAANTMDFTNRLWELGSVAWDVFLASDFLPRAHITKLIQHYVWTDRNAGNDRVFPDQESLSIVDSEAVVFHRNKNGSLIARLREGAAFLEGPRGQAIYTYYEPVAEICGEESGKLIELWKREWRKAGWNPVVLNEGNAFTHSLYEGFCKAIEALPSLNAAGYERACYLRWLAMANVGGGWMCDYDVMPRDFLPRPATERLTVHQDYNPCPSLVSGSGAEFERICRLFMSYKVSEADRVREGDFHCSDMTILQRHAGEYETTDSVMNYGKPGWQGAKGVHFANGTMPPEGRGARAAFIPGVLEGLSQGDSGRAKFLDEPLSLTEQIRRHCEALSALVEGNAGRKAMVQKGLRAVSLIAEKARK